MMSVRARVISIFKVGREGVLTDVVTASDINYEQAAGLLLTIDHLKEESSIFP